MAPLIASRVPILRQQIEVETGSSVEGENAIGFTRLRPAVAGLRRAGPPLHDGSGEAGIAIDRFDGTIVGQQLEEVTE